MIGRILRRKLQGLAEELLVELGGEGRVRLLDPSANFFGLESRGVWQVRGNGCLAVTADRVVFRQLAPRRDVVIPRERILAVEPVRWHLGKRRRHELLRIAWWGESVTDRAAWLLSRNLRRWLDELGAGASGHGT
ncbi:MAG: hypothetical protein U5R31_00825 [Acidimicrobiia bacterium]|nr:hypothetical protein [Acidimicrobiia bacterium]